MIIDKLIGKIKETRNPVCIGLDTVHGYLPEDFFDGSTLSEAAAAILNFNTEMIDAICDLIPAVKVQAACYELYGTAGMETFYRTLEYASMRGLVTIADVKRNDIGSTAACYAGAYLNGVEINGQKTIGFDADFVTVNPYLGWDGVKPFVDACQETGKGLFCLVRTSNKSAGEFQDQKIGGRNLYELVGDKVSEWGAGLIGENGYSSVGAVVGATYPEEAKALRANMRHTFFLIPGYGAQGATADDIAVNFDQNGLGGIVNSSRGILTAYRKDRYAGMKFDEAARAACIDMREDILAAFARNGIEL